MSHPSPGTGNGAGSTDASLFLAVLDRLRETREGRWLIGQFASATPDALAGATASDAAGLPAGMDAAGLLEAVSGPAGSGAANAGADAELRHQLEAMAESIAATRAEIASLRAPHAADGQIDEATSELDAIVKATEIATSTILEAAERMDDVANSVAALEDGSAAAVTQSETIGELTAEIFTACSFQDITGQRIAKVVHVLKEIEARLAALTGQPVMAAPARDARPDAHLLNGPASGPGAADQADVDAIFA